MEFDNNTIIIASVIGGVLVAILLFCLLKGVMRMLILALGIALAVASWIFFYKNGLTFLSLVIPSPHAWMVHVLAWGVALFILAVTIHGMRWCSHVLTLHRNGGATGVLTTIFMCLLVLWLTTIGISYYGDVCRIAYYHDLAEAQMGRAEQPALPFFTRAKDAIRSSKLTSWLECIDPLENPAQTNLACLVAFGCTLDEPTCISFYQVQLANRGIPHPYRLLDLFRDPGLRTMVQEESYVSLLENERLTTFLQFKDSEEHFRNIL